MPEDKLSEKNKLPRLTTGEQAGRLPDSFYQVDLANANSASPENRVDNLALKTVQEFLEEIKDLEKDVLGGFEYFYENVSKYFKTLEIYAKTLLLDKQFEALLVKNNLLFSLARDIFNRLSNKELVAPTEIEEIVIGYKNFLNEAKTLFENFKTTNPER